MPVWLSAAAMAVCAVSGIYSLRGRRRKRGYLTAGIILLLAGIAFALYILAAILLIGAID